MKSIMLVFVLSSCAVEVGDDALSFDETESELSGTLTCTGVGYGTCTASAPVSPSSWTISRDGRNAGTVRATSPTTAGWSCSGSALRTITAGTVGSATVRCR